ncbi:MAG: GDP-mannose 4,6-dehydratase [Acidobacteria bacterium]|nr:GDP-mannose 4,6-dehydratase [Acidobacteriota bacterium]
MSLLITGGCGFIGVNLIERLRKIFPAILVLDDLSVGRTEYLQAVVPELTVGNAAPGPRRKSKGVHLVRGDIRDNSILEALMPGVQTVVHLAAHTNVINSIANPVLDFAVNVQGTFNLLEVARRHGVQRIIFASSGAALGEQTPPVHEKQAPIPLSPYGAAKLFGEGYCSAYYHSYGLDTVALRFSNVYGPRSHHKGSVIAHYCKQVLQGKPLAIHGDGEQTRDFLYVEDLCEGIINCLDANRKGAPGNVFQIATGKETKIVEVAERIMELARQSGRDTKIIYQPARRGEVVRNYARISKAKRLLGFRPRMRLREGIKVTWDWFRQNYPAS